MCCNKHWDNSFLFPGRRRFLLIGVSVMAVSILTLGTIAHYISLGHPTRECHFNMTTPLRSSNPTSTHSNTNSTYISRTLPTLISTVLLNQTESTAITANKGLRYFTLGALVLFVGAYSFSFGPGESVGGRLRTISSWYPVFYYVTSLGWSPFLVAWKTCANLSGRFRKAITCLVTLHVVV